MAYFAISMVLLAVSSHALTSWSLGGDMWTVRSENGSISAKMSVPGSVNYALQNASVVPDFAYRNNLPIAQQIAMENWILERTFDLPTLRSDSTEYYLEFRSLETIATVFVNDVAVLTSSNMFCRQFVAVKNLQATGNSLRILFESPVNYASNRADVYPYKVPHASFPSGLPNYNQIRQTQSSFGWDWGPALAPVGVYRDVYLLSSEGAMSRVMDVSVFTVREGDQFLVSARVRALFTGSYDGELRVTSSNFNMSQTVHVPPPNQWGPVSLPGFWRHSDQPGKPNDATAPQLFELWAGSTNDTMYLEGVFTLNTTVSAKDIEIWWPVNYGNQPLYNVTANLSNADSKTVQFGYRDVDLVRAPIPGEEGTSFWFKINGQMIFAKGASIVPFDALDERVTYDRLRRYLEAAVAGNHNMERVWGGGDYGSDDLYDIADSLGLLLWVDMGSASALYPRDRPFLKSVEREIRDQVWRISGHPSVVMYCGSNEAIIDTNRSTTVDTIQMYTADLQRLFVTEMRRAMWRADPFTAFLASSPSNDNLIDEPWNDMSIPRFGSNAFDPRWGDVRHYGYTGDCLDISSYPIGRIVSEYGLESFPSFETLAPTLAPEDYNPFSEVLTLRNHHGNGNQEQYNLAQYLFRVPSINASTPPSQELLERFIFLSQGMQAWCIESMSLFFRSLRSTPGAYTGGALIWQLNDIWQAPSWAMLESGAYPRAKMLYYTTKRFFAPLTLYPSYYDTSDSLNISALADNIPTTTTQSSTSLTYHLFSYSSTSPLLSKTIPSVPLPIPEATTPIFNTSISSILRNFPRNDPQTTLTLQPKHSTGPPTPK